MALKKDYFNPKNRLSLKSAYYRIIKFDWNFIDETSPMYILVDVHQSKEDRQAKVEPIERISFPVMPDDLKMFFSEDVLERQGVTLKRAGYAFLKTLPDFSGALDDK